MAVTEGGRIVARSPAAAARGVAKGMRTGGAVALVPDLEVLDRSPIKESQALEALILALFQFTPEATIQPDNSIHLNIGASLTLFGGPLALCRKVRACAALQGLPCEVTIAPTSGAAWLLGRARGHVRVRRPLSITSMRAALDRIPCWVLPACRPYSAWLHEVGVHTLGQLRALPRSALQRRTTKELLRELDTAYGEVPALHQWIAIPATFRVSMETTERVEHTDALLTGANALLAQLVGWLRVSQLSVSAFALELIHERGREAVPPTTIEVRLAAPTWQDTHLMKLLAERLARVQLPAPVIGMRLEALQLLPMEPQSASLFPDPRAGASDRLRFLELLDARLGPESILVPSPVPDHRPEVFNRWVPASTAKREKADSPDRKSIRPFWLLDKPIALVVRDERPFYRTPLRIVRGPERIEAGWWQDSTTARDYFVAQADDTSCFWIFRERSAEARWYLHGIFA